MQARSTFDEPNADGTVLDWHTVQGRSHKATGSDNPAAGGRLTEILKIIGFAAKQFLRLPDWEAQTPRVLAYLDSLLGLPNRRAQRPRREGPRATMGSIALACLAAQRWLGAPLV